jgi:hypothetical protein
LKARRCSSRQPGASILCRWAILLSYPYYVGSSLQRSCAGDAEVLGADRSCSDHGLFIDT